MQSLRLIGYWRNDKHPEYPDPHEFIDPDWEPAERDAVSWFLASGRAYRAYMGLSTCRICGQHNGAMEYTDGVYLWPEGLAHYVEEHRVRLPAEVVSHALHVLGDDEVREVDQDWWITQMCS